MTSIIKNHSSLKLSWREKEKTLISTRNASPEQKLVHRYKCKQTATPLTKPLINKHNRISVIIGDCQPKQPFLAAPSGTINKSPVINYSPPPANNTLIAYLSVDFSVQLREDHCIWRLPLRSINDQGRFKIALRHIYSQIFFNGQDYVIIGQIFTCIPNEHKWQHWKWMRISTMQQNGTCFVYYELFAYCAKVVSIRWYLIVIYANRVLCGLLCDSIMPR